MWKFLNGKMVWTALDPEPGKDAGANPAPAPAPAVHVERTAWTKSDLEKMVADSVGKAVIEAMKQSQEEARKQHDLTHGKAFELRPSDIMRAGKIESDKSKGMLTAKYLGWMFRGLCDPDKAYRIAKKAGADETVLRALGESSLAAGGAFVPEVISADYIELLYNNSVFLSAQPTRVPVPHGNLTMPKLATGATAAWTGESQNITKSEQTTSQVRLDLKKLAVVTPISNELLRDSSPSIEQMVRDDLAQNAAVTIDTAFLRGTGTAYSPAGIKTLVASANKFNANATGNVANVTFDLLKAARLLEDAKIRFVRPAWFISPTVRWGLMAARDAQGQLVWAPEMATGKLYGMPFFVTQNIPSNLGGSTDESEVYLVDMVHMVVGEDPAGTQIAMGDGVAYHDGSNVQAAFSRDESAIRLIQRVDLAARQGGNEISLIEQVDWDQITAT